MCCSKVSAIVKLPLCAVLNVCSRLPFPKKHVEKIRLSRLSAELSKLIFKISVINLLITLILCKLLNVNASLSRGA